MKNCADGQKFWHGGDGHRKGATLKGKRLPQEAVERRRRTARELGLRPPLHPGERPWTKRELRLLGTMPDADLAARIGRTETEVLQVIGLPAEGAAAVLTAILPTRVDAHVRQAVAAALERLGPEVTLQARGWAVPWPRKGRANS